MPLQTANSKQSSKQSLNKCISDLTRNHPALTQFDALSLRLASPSVPALQAQQVPVSPVDWPHARSWCPVPTREPELSFLQWSGGATGHYSSWFSSGLSEARPSYKEREWMPRTYCILTLGSWPIFMLKATITTIWPCITDGSAKLGLAKWLAWIQA